MYDRLDKCFAGSTESPPRLIQKEPDLDTAEDHLAKAEMNIAAMELIFQNKFFDWTIVNYPGLKPWACR
jgi:hypothetical protein